jgi:hypothetical protein
VAELVDILLDVEDPVVILGRNPLLDVLERVAIVYTHHSNTLASPQGI